MDIVMNLIEASALNPSTATGKAFLVIILLTWIASCVNVNKRQTERRENQSNQK